MLNLTPHTVTVRPLSGGPDFVYPASGLQARVRTLPVPAPPSQDGCPCVVIGYGEADLPPEAGPGPYIVSTMFADAFRAQHPDDPAMLYVPDSGPTAIRENGQIMAVRALIRK